MANYVVHRCRLFEYIPCAIQCIASSANSSDVAVSRADGSIEIWSTSHTWFPKLTIPGSTERSVESLIWVGNRLISGGLNAEVTEYNLSSGTLKMSVDSYGGAVWCLCSSSEGQVAAGCEDGSVKIFNTHNKKIKFERTFDKQEGRILSISWHVSGEVIVTGSTDVIRMWSAKTGHAVKRILLERLMKKVETIVWSVAIMTDYTIVSGDSYGRVQFWNGKNATLLKSHQVHRADVLCLCVDEKKRSVFASGVDSKVSEFNQISPSDPTSWVAGRSFQKHTHDVRALALRQEQLISGGVDTNLVMRHISRKNDQIRKSYSFPTKNLVSLSKSAKLLLLQYSRHLDVWRLANSSTVEEEDLQPGYSIAIEEEPIKLVQIKLPSSDPNQITCSCISACGRWLVYSTVSSTRLYRLSSSGNEPLMKITRVHCFGLTPAHKIVFTPDSDHVILSATNHKLLIVRLDVEASEARLVQTIPLQDCTSVTHLLAVSSHSKYLATANLEGNVNVYDITNMTHHCTLPHYQKIPTAMTFHPSTNDLILAYSDLQALEYSISNHAYSRWTKEMLVNNKKPILETLREEKLNSDNFTVVTNIDYIVTSKQNTTFFYCREGIYIIERRTKTTKKMGPHLGARFCRDFAPLLYCGFLNDQTLLVVERPMQNIYEHLPPTLYQKKFGT